MNLLLVVRQIFAFIAVKRLVNGLQVLFAFLQFLQTTKRSTGVAIPRSQQNLSMFNVCQ